MKLRILHYGVQGTHLWISGSNICKYFKIPKLLVREINILQIRAANFNNVILNLQNIFFIHEPHQTNGMQEQFLLWVFIWLIDILIIDTSIYKN